MASEQTDNLFKLVKSLTKAEKRSFKLYAKRLSAGENSKFMKLFDVLDKQQIYDEALLLKKASEIKPSQLSNIKAHLYKSILISLHLNNQNNDVDITLHQQLDYAKILYNRGLYRQSLKMLEKAKTVAENSCRDFIRYEIIEFEKLIESQYITNSIKERSETLSVESDKVSDSVRNVTYFSNFALKLYSFYLRIGYVRNERDYLMVENLYKSTLDNKPHNPDSFLDRLYFFQAHVWYNLITQDFINVYKYSLSWVNMFEENSNMRFIQPDLYFKGYGNLLNSLYFIGQYDKFCLALQGLKDFVNDDKLAKSYNNRLLGFKYLYENLINKHFLEGTFREGVKLIPEIEKQLEELRYHIDIHWEIIIHYKIACLYFGADEHRLALKYLNKIINVKDDNVNRDIQSFARILALISYYELGDVDFLDHQIRSVYRFLLQQKDLYRVQKVIIKFLKSLPYLSVSEANNKILEHIDILKKLQQDRFEKRPFLYLDFVSWLESKIQNCTVEEVIGAKWNNSVKRIFLNRD
ncbi:MAG: hypothetical protein N4A72_13860 [Bacteroidales bacterium]|jgi:tetratricopeptide (TPR) repeat protein|nr:hypothetical protein [Bacteroidales bacterium]